MALFKEGLLCEPLYDIVYVVRLPQNKSSQEHLGKVKFIFGSRGVTGFIILVIFKRCKSFGFFCFKVLLTLIVEWRRGNGHNVFFFINVHFRTTVLNP